MLPAIIGGLLAGAGSAVGGLIQNSAQEDRQREANQANINSAREQMAFQKEMSSTAYQRAMADMRQAGLNPMLAYMQGGASSPTGAAGVSQAPTVQDYIGKGVSSATEALRLKKEFDAVDTQTKLNTAISATQEAQTELNKTNAKTAQKNNEILDAQMPAIKQQSKADLEKAKYDTDYAGADALTKRLGILGGVLGTAKDLLKPGPKVRNWLRGPTDRELERAGRRGITVP